MTVPVEPELLLHQTDWTLEQYERMVAGGILTPEDRVELLFGKIVHKLAVGDLHVFCVQELNYAMIERFGRRFTCRQEQPISLPEHSAPEPDYVLAAPAGDRYFNRKRIDYVIAHDAFRSEVLGEITMTDFIPAVAWK